MSNGPFVDAKNTVVFTTRHVIDDNAPILRVSHNADDGAWQFHAVETPMIEDARLLALEEVLEIDPSVGELADLPLGWFAVRSSVAEPWKRYQADEVSDEETV